MAERRNLPSSPLRWIVWSGHSCPLSLTLTLPEARQARNMSGPTVEERRFSAAKPPGVRLGVDEEWRTSSIGE